MNGFFKQQILPNAVAEYCIQFHIGIQKCKKSVFEKQLRYG